MLAVVYVYVLSDTLHFILLKMVLRDTAVNINSTLTEKRQTRNDYIEREIEINTTEQCGLSVC